MLKYINYIVQLFCIRIALCEEKIIDYFDVKCMSILENGGSSMGGYGIVNVYRWYSIKYWVMPFSGWGKNNPYRYIGKSDNYFKITNKKLVK